MRTRVCFGAVLPLDVHPRGTQGDPQGRRGSHLHLSHALWGTCLSGLRAGSNMYVVCLIYSDQACNAPQLIRPVINSTLVCMVLDPRLVNYGTCQCLLVALPQVLPVGLRGRAGGATQSSLGVGGLRQNQHPCAYICYACYTCPYFLCLLTPASACPYLLYQPIPAVPCLHPLTLGYTHSPTERATHKHKVGRKGLMWLLRLTHKVHFISIQNVAKISRSF